MRANQTIKYCFFLLFFVSLQINGQEASFEEKIQKASFEELIVLYDQVVTDTVSAKKIARAYIEKGKKVGDSLEMARGYSRLSFVSNYPNAIQFLDSTIVYSANSNHPNFPTIGHLFKSLYHYNNEAYEESLQEAIEAYKYAKKKNNIEHQVTALHQINGINELWGDYQKTLEAEKLTFSLLQEHKELNRYYEHYMASLEGLGKCYVRLNYPDSALYFFKKGIWESLKVKDTITYYAFVSRIGSALYLQKEYAAALDSLEKAHEKKEYFVNSYPIYYHYYKGLILKEIGNEDLSIANFKRIDSLFQKDEILTPELPEVYHKLVAFYKQQNNPEEELYYLYQLVSVDSMIDAKQIYIKEKTTKDYTIPNLLEGKNKFIEGLQEENQKANTKLWIVLFLLLLVFGIGFYYFNRQQIYRKRYEQLMHKGADQPSSNPLNDKKSLDISEEIVQELMDKLETFEKEKKYLSSDISLNEVAKMLGTNSTYLSNIINHEKQKNFSNYINHLRVAYAFEELRNNPTFRKYTIKAIAEESGFNNAESFSKTFYKIYGLYPSFYVRKLKEEKD